MTTINEHPAAADLPAWENKRLREENAIIWDDLIDERRTKKLWRALFLLGVGGYGAYRFLTWIGWL